MSPAPLVYVNYGRPEDYDELDALGISVRGAIVIARYGGSFRGTKPKIAAEHGAIGCLIYSDPRDDGYYADAVFPDGPMRNKDGVQRGSVMDLPTYSGDPLTPGIAAVPGAKRLSISEAATITKIPVLPISYGDAQPLLAAMSGPIAPAAWRGALPITYRVGPGPAQVHLKVSFNWDTKPIYNVIATLPGSTFPDEWIVRGNHHDAWVNGAADPVSGMAPELEEARALGQLVKQGWRPKRTIVYTAWDGEEPGLIGSTEWVEQHDDELRRKAVVYINSDGNGRGFLQAIGLAHARAVRQRRGAQHRGSGNERHGLGALAGAPHCRRPGGPSRRKPLEGRSADRRARIRIGLHAVSPASRRRVAEPVVRRVGRRRDLSLHLRRLLSFHEVFRSRLPVRPGARAVCRHGDVMRLADADILPYEFTGLADTVQTYVREVQALLKQRQDEVQERNRQVTDGVFAAVRDPKRPRPIPPLEEVPPALNFAPLENAASALTRAADRYHKAVAAARQRVVTDNAQLQAINARLIQSERQFIDEQGLPRRSWYRHLLYAPGYYTGYGVKTHARCAGGH